MGQQKLLHRGIIVSGHVRTNYVREFLDPGLSYYCTEALGMPKFGPVR